MTLRWFARRGAAAALLAALGTSIAGPALAQQGVLLPAIGSAPESRATPGWSGVARGLSGAEPVAPAPIATLPGAIVPATPPLPVSPALPPAPPPAVMAVPTPGSYPVVPAQPPVATPGNPAACPAGPAPTDVFARMPPISPFPRPGNFPVSPTGPGYYTFEDVLTDNLRQGPPKYPYPRTCITPFSMFDLDWRYLDDPNNTEHDYWDGIKRQRFGPNDSLMFTGGGEFRARYAHEENSRAQVHGQNDTYDLYRLRLYADISYLDRVRFFIEGISALSPDYFLPPLVIDRNKADLLNAFVDLNLFEVAGNPVWFRAGRQELLYGSQRLISPLDWANTRRTFQGGKLFYRSEKDDFDLFCVQPVIPNVDRFDSVDNNQVFAGAWYTHRPVKSQTIDAYYLMLDNTNPVFIGQNGRVGGETVHTVGGRWVGDDNNVLWDLEGMVQFGGYAHQSILANAFTAGVGYAFKDAWASPNVWVYYDHASGEGTPGQGSERHTFNQLFPFGHYYFGYADLVGRQNINDFNLTVNAFPAKWIFAQFQLHNFFLDSARDSLYNAAGRAIRTSPNGTAGTSVGQELDFVLNFHLTNHSDVFFSYSYLFAGSVIKDTAADRAGRRDPQALYVQYAYRF